MDSIIASLVVDGECIQFNEELWLAEKQAREASAQRELEHSAKLRDEFLHLLEPHTEEFGMILRSFQPGSLAVQPPRECLESRIVEALAAFGLHIDGITTATVDTVNQVLSERKSHVMANTFFKETLDANIDGAIASNYVGYELCSQLFDEAVGSQWHGAVFAENRLSEMKEEGGFNWLGFFTGRLARDLVTAYMYARVVEWEEYAFKVRNLFQFFFEGNYPVYALKDKTFLVITA